MSNLQANLPTELKAYIHQNTNDLQAYLLPQSKLSLVFINSDRMPPPYKAKFVFQSPGIVAEAEAEAEDPFEAIRLAKEKMSLFLKDMQSEISQGLKGMNLPKTLH